MGDDTMHFQGLPSDNAKSSNDPIDEAYRRATTTPAADLHTFSRTNSNFTSRLYFNTPQSRGHTLQGPGTLGYFGAYPTQAGPATPTPLPGNHIAPINFNNNNFVKTSPRFAPDTGSIESSPSASEPSPSQHPKKKPKQVQPKKFPCNWKGKGGPCLQMFTCPHNVDQHVREKHSGERPYACPDCPKAFPRPYSMYRHVKTCHGRDIGPGRGKGQTNKDRKLHKKEVRKEREKAAKEESDQGATQLDSMHSPVVPEDEVDMLSAAQDDSFYVQFQTIDNADYPLHELANTRVDSFNGLGNVNPGILLPADEDHNSFAPNIVPEQQQPVQPFPPAAQTIQPNENDIDISFDLDIFENDFDMLNLNSPDAMNVDSAPTRDTHVTCAACGEVFDDDQGVIEHLHVAHDLPRNEHCFCWGCQLMTGSQKIDEAKALAEESQKSGRYVDWEEWVNVQ